MIVTEERIKFWFGFQLLTLAVACAAVGWWRSDPRPMSRVGSDASL